MSLSANIQEKANLIWAIADKLVGPFEPHEYGEVILPLVVIKRFDCILAATKDKVLEEYKQVQGLGNKDLIDARLKAASGVEFYNISPFTLERLLDAPNNIASNFRAYLGGFSENIQTIIEKFDFDTQLTRLIDKDLLYIIIQEMCSPKADLHPSKISNLEMGYIFEEIIRRFSEAHNGAAGQHYTPREVIRLMVNILFDNDSEILTEKTVKTIYDPTAGTGGMLSVASEYLAEMNKDAKLLCYGQEINDKTFAICKADMLIKGEDANNIKNGNTLSDDKFTEGKFSYVLSNPPFGIEWKKEKAAVESEAKLGFGGRFGAGLPPISDSQMLFLQICMSKLNPEKGKACVIQNGSPLFSGDAESGQSEIRRYLLEHDYLDAIIGLPNDIFYNTGIATYIWVLSTKKTENRKGKVILINANEMYEKRRKSLGSKRNDIPENAIAEITRVYSEFKETEISKIFHTSDFGYYKVTVERPMRDENGNIVLKKDKPVADPKLRDTESIPMNEDIDEYFKREVLPFAPDAWIDKSKTKVGYEIPFTRYFYKYTPPRKSEDIMVEIKALQSDLDTLLKEVA